MARWWRMAAACSTSPRAGPSVRAARDAAYAAVDRRLSRRLLPPRHRRREIARELERQSGENAARLTRFSRADPPVSTLAAGAHAATADAAFVGHYYLSGVMETGSSCSCGPMARLRGTCPMARWSAEGTWLRDGDAVVLTARQPDRSAPLFALAGVDAWDADAEPPAGRQHDDATAAWEERCGSAAEAVTAVVAPLVDDAPHRPGRSVSAHGRSGARPRPLARPRTVRRAGEPAMRPPCRPIAGRAASPSRSLPSRTASAWA
jgi:hypothetical protein